MDIEAQHGSETATAIIVSNELAQMESDKRTQQEQHCANCDIALCGAYCHACGQSAHIHRSLLHMIEELLHGLFHFDTKAWRTVPALIFRPGHLTREYIAGKRTSYVSPLALFLFLIFFMFFVFSNTIDESQHQFLEVQRTAPEVSKTPAPSNSLLTLTRDQANGETLDPHFKASDLPDYPRLAKLLESADKDRKFTLYKMKKNAASMAFILIPISLPFLWLLFAFQSQHRRRYVMFDHTVFALYSLAFMSLLMTVIALLAKLNLSGTGGLLFMLVPPLHMYLQLKHAYQLSTSAAVWRTLALLVIAALSLLTYAVLVTLFSA